jgi:hypothetical protein
MTILLLDQTRAINLSLITTIAFQTVDEPKTADVEFVGGTKVTHLEGEPAERLFRIVNEGGTRPGLESPTVPDIAESLENASAENKENASSSPEIRSLTTSAEIEEAPIGLNFVPARMKLNKAWYYLKSEDESGYFLAFVNKDGASSMRTFSAENGLPCGPTNYPKPQNEFQTAFGKLIEKSRGPLHVPYQPNLVTAMKQGLPREVLEYLKQQI